VQSDLLPRIWVGEFNKDWQSFAMGKWSRAPSGVAGKICLAGVTQQDYLVVSLLNIEPNDGMLLILHRDSLLG
jgi:hypothetical protein